MNCSYGFWFVLHDGHVRAMLLLPLANGARFVANEQIARMREIVIRVAVAAGR